MEPLDIQFSTKNCHIQILNLLRGRFENRIPEHYHGKDCYELHYIPNGYGILHIKKEEYRIVPGTLYITGPQIHHEQIPANDEPMSEYCLYIKVWGKSGRTKKEQKLEAFEQAFLSTPFWFGRDNFQVETLLKQLFWELETRTIGYQKQIELITLQIIIMLVRNYQGNSHVTLRSRYLRELQEQPSVIMENYFLNDYASASLEELSNRLNVGKRQAQRMLKEYYGKTFQQKKTEARMALAHQFLVDKAQSIAKVSEELGFSTSEQFSKAFHNHYGMSPREYRNENRRP